jgi:hypothetical protein
MGQVGITSISARLPILSTEDAMNSKLLLVLAAFSASCADDVSPLGQGEIALTWQISPRGCADANVTNVVVGVRGPETRTEIFECDRGEAMLFDLTAGTYAVSIEGIDEDGIARFTSADSRVTVHPELTTPNSHTRLVAKPSEAVVSWRFEDGRVCGAHGLTQMNISAFDKFDYQVATVDADCNQASTALSEVFAGTYLIQVTGVGDDGVWTGDGTISLQRGESAKIEVVLSPSL